MLLHTVTIHKFVCKHVTENVEYFMQKITSDEFFHFIGLLFEKRGVGTLS